MQIALEKTLRENIQRLAAEADCSMKDWILDNILALHHEMGIGNYLTQKYGSILILATPTNCSRFNILITNPTILNLLDELSESYQRSKPQIVYTIVTNLVDDNLAKNTSTANVAKTA